MTHKSGSKPGMIAFLRLALARFTRRTGLRQPKPARLTSSSLPRLSVPQKNMPASLAASSLPRLAMPPDRPASETPSAGLWREYAVPLARKHAPHHVRLRLSIPVFPPGIRDPAYGEHSGHSVIALSRAAVAQSDDLGRSWRVAPLNLDAEPRCCFTTSHGTHLVCTQNSPDGARIHRYDAGWRRAGAPFAIGAPWHGSASIGEARGTLMFAEYPDNKAKYHADDPTPLLPGKVWRSRDDGVSWQLVKTVGPDVIRHLHTLAPEQDVPGRWWLSSGDRSGEVFIWRSDDDGDSWADVTEEQPDVPLHPGYVRHARASQRMTDLAFHDGYMIWGADDWLGFNPQNADERPAAGSRIFRARTEGAWKVEALAFCGKPVRNIVDVGPAFLFTTEAKHLDRGGRPDVFLLFKDDLTQAHHLAQIDNYIARGTGFTYSLASRAAEGGVFFSHRGVYDAFHSETRLLKWEISFDSD